MRLKVTKKKWDEDHIFTVTTALVFFTWNVKDKYIHKQPYEGHECTQLIYRNSVTQVRKTNLIRILTGDPRSNHMAPRTGFDLWVVKINL